MTDADWARLELAEGFRADGVHATAGQVGAQLLHDAIARATGTSMAYADDSTRAGRTLLAAERVNRGRGRATAAPHIGSSLHVELPNVAIAVHPVQGNGSAAGVTVTEPRSGARWTVHSIVLHTSKSR
jgi:hypothetical protein